MIGKTWGSLWALVCMEAEGGAGGGTDGGDQGTGGNGGTALGGDAPAPAGDEAPKAEGEGQGDQPKGEGQGDGDKAKAEGDGDKPKAKTALGGDAPKEETPEEKEAREAKEAEDKEKAFEDQRAARAPETYADYELPDGYAADPELKAKFDPLAKKFGLNQAESQELVNFFMETQAKAHADWVKTTDTWLEEAKADEEIGRAAWDENLAIARSARDTFFDPEFKDFLEETGLGNHRRLIQGFVRIGKLLGTKPALKGEPVARDLALKDVLYT